MGKSYMRLMRRSIRGSLARFFSILAIVAIGVGFLGGLLATTPDMKLTMDEYYDQYNVYDINIKGTLGITGDDLETVRNLDFVEQAMPAHVTDLIMANSEGSYVARIYGVSSFEKNSGLLNGFELVEGRLPENENECLITVPDSYGESFKTGDQYTISEENKDYDSIGDTYGGTKLTAVGIVNSPIYISYESEPSTVGDGSVDLVIFAYDSFYSMDVFTDLFVTVKGAKDLNTFSEDYSVLVSAASEKLEETGIGRSTVRYDSVIAEANEKLDEAQDEYDKAKADAEEKLNEAKEEIDKGKKALSDGEAELEKNRKTLQDSETQLNNAQAELNASIAENRQKIEDNLERMVNEQYASLSAQIDQAEADGKGQIEENRKALAAAKDEIDKNGQLIDEKSAELAAGRTEVENGKAQIEAGKNEIASGRQSIEASRAQLKAEIDAQKAQLEAAKPGMSEDEYNEALALINQTEQDKTAEIDTAESQLDSQESQLLKKEDELAQAEARITAGETELETARDKLNDAKAQYESGISQLEAADNELNTAIAGKRAELEHSIPQIRSTIYSEAMSQIDSARAEAQAQIDENRKKLEDGKAQLRDGENTIASSKQELEDGEKEYNDKKAEADKELADAQAKINDARKKVSEIENPEWYTFDRGDNVSYKSYKSNSEKVAAVATVFPIFFFLVAALVALTTMTRMVEEERTQIGTLKALGYTNGVILSYYVSYGVIASLVGSVIGITLGFFTLPAVIANAYAMMFTLPPTTMIFHWNYALLIIPTAVICITAAVLFACVGQLREKPSALMQQRAPKAGKRILLERIKPLWKHLSFTQKVTSRNIFRYKKRLLMTVIGIAGCCALLVAGFGIRDSIRDIADKQFGEIYTHNLIIAVKDAGDLNNDPVVSSVLKDTEAVKDYAEIHTETVKISGNDVSLYVPRSTEELKEEILLRNRVSGETLDFSANSVILTEKLCETLSLKVGDKFTMENSDGREAEFTLTGIAESYVSSYMFISTDMYRGSFSTEPSYKTALVKTTEGGEAFREGLSEKLLSSDQVLYLSFMEAIEESFKNTVKNIDYIVMVLIFSAGGLAVIVLYNLTNINICERKRELATLKVLGFHSKETAMYIYRETFFLCLIGIAAGFFLGIFLHGFVIQTAEVDAVMFGREIYPLSYILAAVITLFFTVLVDLIMLKKLRKINMVESMKANE